MGTLDYQHSLHYLYGLQKMGVKLGLTNIRRLLELLGDPQREFCSVHVAGSNGKGSTCAQLAAILQAAGFKVGLYTSPHLVDFSERIKVDGAPVARERVAQLSERLRELVAGSSFFRRGGAYPTFFEMVTAMAFEHFRREGVDVAVLETGMGGRLDATNVVCPRLSIITNISLEHCSFLGDTLAAIATEKAGIVKEGVPLLTAVSQPEALRQIEQVCDRRGAPLHRLQREVELRLKRRWPRPLFDLQTPVGCLQDLSLNLLGDFQLQNAALAVRAAQLLAESGLAVGESAIRRGLEKSDWPGRLQLVGRSPWLLLDGAHNPAAVEQLLHELSLFSHKRLLVVLGLMQDKEAARIVSLFARAADVLIFTRADIPRALAPRQLAAEVEDFSGQVLQVPSVPRALRQALTLAGSEDLVCLTGSLYLVGEAQAWLQGRPMETIRSVQ